MIDEHLLAQRDALLARVDGLIRRGRELLANLHAGTTRGDASRGPDGGSPLAAPSIGVKIWQQDCAAAVSELSGGSKAHWLARAFSQAFLVRSTGAGVVVEASEVEIVQRLLDVLARGRAALAETDGGGAAPAPRRFDFVHNESLRPVLEQAYHESSALLQEGAFDRALVTCCGVLEAIVTDALEHRHQSDKNGRGISTWSFDERMTEAERTGLIGRGCARLPPVARQYRDRDFSAGGSPPAASASERDVRVTRQVLHVIMRDLDPGR